MILKLRSLNYSGAIAQRDRAKRIQHLARERQKSQRKYGERERGGREKELNRER